MDLQELLTLLASEAERQGRLAYLVGGCIRDGLLGRPVADLDVVLAGDVEGWAHAVAERLDGTYVPLGERFGTARVVLRAPADGVQYVDVTRMAGDLDQDLRRRDFTVNAMAAPLGGPLPLPGSAQGIEDPLGGLRDLQAGVLRMVGPEVLDADPVRALRGVRFATQLRFALDERTETAIAERARLLAGCAPERIREELVQVLAGEAAVRGVELLDRLGLLEVILPELVRGKGVGQPKEHHWEVFQHEVETLAAVEVLVERRLPPGLENRPWLRAAVAGPWHPALEGYFDQRIGGLTRRTLLRLAALLHDVGKPATKWVQPDGRTRFFGHAELGAEMVREMLARLRFSRQETEAVALMVEEHLRPGQWSDGGLPSARALYRYFRDLRDVAIDTMFLNMGDHLAARGPALEPGRWRAHVAIVNYALESFFAEEERTHRPRLVTGRDLMEELGLTPGPLVGRLLREIDEAHSTGAIATREEAIRLARHSLNTGGERVQMADLGRARER